VNWSSIAIFLADADEQPVFVIDGGGVVRLCNRALERLVGRPRREIVGHAWQRLVDTTGRDKVGRAVRMVRQGTPRRCEIALRSAEDEQLAADLVLHPVGEDAVGFVVHDGLRHKDDLGRLLRARVEALSDRHLLSGREREVLDHLIRGASIEDIGSALGITPRTAKFHQANVLAKLGIASRVELTRIIVEPDR